MRHICLDTDTDSYTHNVASLAKYNKQKYIVIVVITKTGSDIPTSNVPLIP